MEEAYAELATDPEVTAWMAMEGGQVQGIIGFWDEEETQENMLVGPNYFTFSIAATRESARGRGISTALTWNGLRHYRDMGYRYSANSWISPNLSASRFWPRFGYKEAVYRLTRNINPMIAWTR